MLSAPCRRGWRVSAQASGSSVLRRAKCLDLRTDAGRIPVRDPPHGKPAGAAQRLADTDEVAVPFVPFEVAPEHRQVPLGTFEHAEEVGAGEQHHAGDVVPLVVPPRSHCNVAEADRLERFGYNTGPCQSVQHVASRAGDGGRLHAAARESALAKADTRRTVRCFAWTETAGTRAGVPRTERGCGLARHGSVRQRTHPATRPLCSSEQTFTAIGRIVRINVHHSSVAKPAMHRAVEAKADPASRISVLPPLACHQAP